MINLGKINILISFLVCASKLNVMSAFNPAISDTCGITKPIDLVPYANLNDGYPANSVKIIPCLGSINWTGNARYRINTPNVLFELALRTYSDTSNIFIREEIFCTLRYPIIGKHLISSLEETISYSSELGFYSISSGDGDETEALWDLDNSYCNYVLVEDYDPILKILSGTFELHFKQNKNLFWYNHSQHVHFLQGKFYAKNLN